MSQIGCSAINKCGRSRYRINCSLAQQCFHPTCPSSCCKTTLVDGNQTWHCTYKLWVRRRRWACPWRSSRASRAWRCTWAPPAWRTRWTWSPRWWWPACRATSLYGEREHTIKYNTCLHGEREHTIKHNTSLHGEREHTIKYNTSLHGERFTKNELCYRETMRKCGLFNLILYYIVIIYTYVCVYQKRYVQK